MAPLVTQLAECCHAGPTRAKWLIVPGHALGHTLGERLLSAYETHLAAHHLADVADVCEAARRHLKGTSSVSRGAEPQAADTGDRPDPAGRQSVESTDAPGGDPASPAGSPRTATPPRGTLSPIRPDDLTLVLPGVIWPPRVEAFLDARPC